MENNILNYKGKQGVHVPQDVREYVLKRVKEGSKTVKQIAVEHGISIKAIYAWLKKESGGDADSHLAKLQKENHLLKQLANYRSLTSIY